MLKRRSRLPSIFSVEAICFPSFPSGGIENLQTSHGEIRPSRSRLNSLSRRCIGSSDALRAFLWLSRCNGSLPLGRTAGETGASNLLSVRCCQVGVGRYSPPQLDHLTSKLSRLGASGGSNKQKNAALRVRRQE